jgi:glyoxylase I family protein
MSHQKENVQAALNVAPLDPKAKEKARARRAMNRVRGLSHHAYYCLDAEKTRHFYEDILEMPMTIAMRIPEEAFTGAPTPYAHFFFEMGDGSAIAFFDYPDLFDGKPPFEMPSPYHHHIAVNVDGDESIAYYRKRLEEAGYAGRYIDHGAFHSLYVTDPNGMNLELTYTPPAAEGDLLRAEAVAHDVLKEWVSTRA